MSDGFDVTENGSDIPVALKSMQEVRDDAHRFIHKASIATGGNGLSSHRPAMPEKSLFSQLSVLLSEAQRQNQVAAEITGPLLLEWLSQFIEKNKGYKPGWDLGMSGEYAEIFRKTGKLHHSIWDGEKLEGEQPREVVMDLIGHCFLFLVHCDNGKMT